MKAKETASSCSAAAIGASLNPQFILNTHEYEEKLAAPQELLQLFQQGSFTSGPTLSFPRDGTTGRNPLIRRIKLEMTFSLQPNNCLVSKRQCGRQMDVKLDETEDHAGHMCRAGSNILFSSQQQAIEDLQSEEEKVNLLTKEKTKLQMQTEDVRSSFNFI